MGKSENSGFFTNKFRMWLESWYMQTTNWPYLGMWLLKVKIISLKSFNNLDLHLKLWLVSDL